MYHKFSGSGSAEDWVELLSADSGRLVHSTVDSCPEAVTPRMLQSAHSAGIFWLLKELLRHGFRLAKCLSSLALSQHTEAPPNVETCGQGWGRIMIKDHGCIWKPKLEQKSFKFTKHTNEHKSLKQATEHLLSEPGSEHWLCTIYASFTALVAKGKVLAKKSISREQTQSHKQQKCILEIWAEWNISQLLENGSQEHRGVQNIQWKNEVEWI